jgi:hypothetical protein
MGMFSSKKSAFQNKEKINLEENVALKSEANLEVG